MKQIIGKLKIRITARLFTAAVGAATIAAAVTSCIKSDQLLVCDNEKAVVFTLGNEHKALAKGDAAAGTRAAPQHPVQNVPGQIDEGVIPQGSSFGIYAWERDAANTITNFAGMPTNQQVTRIVTGGVSTYPYSPTAYWSLNTADRLSFMAYYPYYTIAQQNTGPLQVVHGTGSNQSLEMTFRVDNNSGNHIDLMYARTPMTQGFNPVLITFRHALSRLMFEGRVEDYPSTADVRITSIKVTNAIMKGKLIVLDPTLQNEKAWWELDATQRGDILMPPAHVKSNVTLGSALQPVMTSSQNTPADNTDGDMLVLPQSTEGLSI
jgi:hypothetical protein